MAHYSVNLKKLSKVIHGKKYLGGTQKKHRASGMKDIELIYDEDEEDEEKYPKIKNSREKKVVRSKKLMIMMIMQTFLKEPPKNLPKTQYTRIHDCQKEENPKAAPNEENLTPDFSPV